MHSIVEVGMTLNYVIDASCTKYRDLGAVGMAMETPLSYGEFHEQIIALALQLQAEGVRKGDTVAILAENSHRWGIAYLAIVRIGAIVVPILPDSPESDVHHILNQMRPKALFTTQKQIEKIYELKKELKKPPITLDDYKPEHPVVVTVETFSDYMERALVCYRERVEDIWFAKVEEDDIASILYTSGTSGYSRAVMLSHKNLTANAYAARTLVTIKPGAVWLSILPMSHTYEFTCGFITPLLAGARIAYAGKTPTPAILQKLCAYEKPFAIFAVPLVMEKIYKKRVMPRVEKNPALKLMCRFGVGRKAIYKKIGARLLDFFGGNLTLMGIGGAALNPEVEQFLSEAEFPYLIGYGMTEASPLIAGGPLGDETIAVGSAGKPIPGTDVRIVDQDPETGIGEIAVCGPGVMTGYYADEEATEEVLTDDGWLSTGDLGYLDVQGNLHICGRSKNVIVMANGENVYPEAIEHKINTCSWVVESLVLENNGQLEAWVYPDYEFIDEKTSGKGSSGRREYILELLESMKEELNRELSRSARLARVFERREPFIKTATHKIKRYLYIGHAMVG